MGNPLFDSMNGNQQLPGPFNNMMNFVQQFNQFRSSFRGDPRQKVQELLSSGQMTQQQFQQLSSMAQQIQKMMR